MPVNYEIKSQLAKLLATEDLIVENRNIETAQFDVERRILTLPMWKRATESVYDMLVGHEVGHALYTPNDWSFEGKIPKQFVNVVEDARIERMMKRRYPGLTKSFYAGYKELSDNDFFELDDVDISEMNLADRINIYYKIGNFVDVPFSDEEKKYVKMVGETETFADVILVSELIYKHCKETKNQEENDEPEVNSSNQSGDHGEETPNDGVSGGSEKKPSENQQNNESEPEVTTDSLFEEKSQELNGNVDNDTTTGYYEIPNVYLDKVIVSNSTIHDELNESWINQLKVMEFNGVKHQADFTVVDKEFKNLKVSSQKEVNYLVKEFECKKSADVYSRSSVSKTGVLDCTKLHTYKYNEDLFRKVSVIPDGKNHGLIFILDWSGSMQHCMLDTIKQLFNLVWFCNKVKIPFDVYAFTNTYINDRNDYLIELQEEKVGTFWLGDDFRLLNILTSKVKTKDLDSQMLSLWRICYSMNNYTNYSYPAKFSLSGTPLHEAIVCLHQIIPEFQKRTGIQKLQCVILTDGEANPLPVYTSYNYNGLNKIGHRHIRPKSSYLRNRKTGHTYQFDYEYYKFTDVLLNDLKQTFPNTNFIGIRLSNSREMNNFIKRYVTLNEQQVKKMKKEKFFNIKDSGYDSFFAMNSNNLFNEVEFDVEEGATKAKIKSAFAKNLKSKSLNKKVLSEFVDLIC